MGAWAGGDGGPQEKERGEERRSKSGLNRGRMVFLLTTRRRGADDYLKMGVVGEWEPDTCGGSAQGGGGACKKWGDHLLQSQAMETRQSLQPSPKMLMVYR